MGKFIKELISPLIGFAFNLGKQQNSFYHNLSRPKFTRFFGLILLHENAVQGN